MINLKIDILKYLINIVKIWYFIVEFSVKDIDGLFIMFYKRDNWLLLVVVIVMCDEIIIN